jgi:hypothetical protein
VNLADVDSDAVLQLVVHSFCSSRCAFTFLSVQFPLCVCFCVSLTVFAGTDAFVLLVTRVEVWMRDDSSSGLGDGQHGSESDVTDESSDERDGTTGVGVEECLYEEAHREGRETEKEDEEEEIERSVARRVVGSGRNASG